MKEKTVSELVRLKYDSRIYEVVCRAPYGILVFPSNEYSNFKAEETGFQIVEEEDLVPLNELEKSLYA